jgi:hypothetical protein
LSVTVAAVAEGWKEIAGVVGRCERTCRRWSKKQRDPLPVYHYLGTVIMNRSEYLAWKKRQARSYALEVL